MKQGYIPKLPLQGKYLAIKESLIKSHIEQWPFIATICEVLRVVFFYVSLWFRREKLKKFLRKNNSGIKCFDFAGARLPDLTCDSEKFTQLQSMFCDTFLIPCFYDDNYDKEIIKVIDKYMPEGPYGYTDGDFDVTIKKGNTVIDAGAWIGDFSAYAASKGAFVYAFEPVSETYKLLQKTAILNTHTGGGHNTRAKGIGCELLR